MSFLETAVAEYFTEVGLGTSWYCVRKWGNEEIEGILVRSKGRRGKKFADIGIKLHDSKIIDSIVGIFEL